MGGGHDPERDAKALDAELAAVAPRMERLLDLAEKRDAENAELAKSVAGEERAALEFLRSGAYLDAASIFDALAVKYRARSFVADADRYIQRAKDARSAHRIKRRSKKGSTR
jgi:hypothetical protein